MTDLELTKRCAKAIGFPEHLAFADNKFRRFPGTFDPLHDDAAAMELLKRFELEIVKVGDEWHVDSGPTFSFGINQSLNRAIVECVAKMQFDRAEEKAPTP